MATLVSEIREALIRDIPFDITFTDDDDPKEIRFFSIWERIRNYFDSSFNKKRISKIAKGLTKILITNDRHQEISSALKDEAVKATRAFTKSIKGKGDELEEVKQCKLEFMASKLGLTSEQIKSNKGFQEFAVNSHLEKYLLHYGHKLEVEENTNEIFIFFEGNRQPWSYVYEQYKQMDFPEPNFPSNKQWKWLYGQDGVQKKDLYAWTELTPYKIEKNHDWGDRYIFEICVCFGDGHQLEGDHAWFRLKTPKGEIYSVGLYRQPKSEYLDNFKFPMRVKKGYLMSPDVTEFWPSSYIKRIPVEITESQFKAIKSKVEEDKRNEDIIENKEEEEKKNIRCFQLFNGNCTEYVNENAKLLDIQIPASINMYRYLIPRKIQKITDKIMSYLPKLVKKICLVILAALTNLVQLALGAAMVDSSLIEKKKYISKKHISGVRDFFNPDTLNFQPPKHLGIDLREKVEKWRSENPDERQYDLPPEWKKLSS